MPAFDKTRSQFYRHLGRKAGAANQSKFFLESDAREATIREAQLLKVWEATDGEWDDASYAVAQAVAKGKPDVTIPAPPPCISEPDSLVYWTERHRATFGNIIKIKSHDPKAEQAGRQQIHAARQRQLAKYHEQLEAGYRAEPEAWTQRAVSEAFAKNYSRGEYRFNADLQGWFAWDGCRFRPAQSYKVYLKTIDYLDHLDTQAEGIADQDTRQKYQTFLRSLETTEKITSTIKGCEALLHIDADDLDTNPHALNVKNGWLNLGNMEFTPHTTPVPFTMVAGTVYDTRWTVPASE